LDLIGHRVDARYRTAGNRVIGHYAVECVAPHVPLTALMPDAQQEEPLLFDRDPEWPLHRSLPCNVAIFTASFMSTTGYREKPI